MLEFLGNKATTHLYLVDIKSKNITEMTALENLHRMELATGLLAAFTRLATRRARPRSGTGCSLGVLFPEMGLDLSECFSDGFVLAEQYNFLTVLHC